MVRKRGMTTAKLGGKTIRFKRGALRNQLKLKPDEKLTRPVLKKASEVAIGKPVEILGRKRKMTKLLKERIVLGMNLQSKKKKSSKKRSNRTSKKKVGPKMRRRGVY